MTMVCIVQYSTVHCRTSLYRVCGYREKHLRGFIEETLCMGLTIPREREEGEGEGKRKGGLRGRMIR
jgi:hypothetical protein